MPNPDAHNLPTIFPDVWDELAILERWRARRESIDAQVGSLTIDQARSMAGLAQVMPYAPAGVVTSLGQALGVDQHGKQMLTPDTPGIRGVAGRTALDANRVNVGLLGKVVSGDQVRPGSSGAKMRTALNAANAAGLINADGEVVKPADRGSPERYLFNEVRDAFINAGTPFPYIDTNNRKAWIRPSYTGPGESARAFHQYEAASSDVNALRAAGFAPILEAAEGHPELRNLALEARNVGLVDTNGYLQNPNSVSSKPAGGTTRGEVFRRLREAFKNAGVDLPFLTDSRGPVVYGVRDGVMGERPVFPNRIPEDDEPGGILPPHFSEIAASGVPGGSDFYQGVQNVLRPTFATLDAPLQELQGLARNVYALAREGGPQTGIASADIGTGLALHPSSQSDLGIAIEKRLAGEPVDVGTGFFVDPDSAVARERVRREAERGQINGQNVTIGRALASAVVEPGSKPFSILSGLVDMGVAIEADPANLALGGLGKLNQGRRVFRAGDDAMEAAGGLRGLRRMVSGPTADAWLDGTQGSRVVEAIAAETSPSAIWRASRGNLEPQLAAQLADVSDPAEVRDVLRPLLGTEIRTTDQVWRDPRGLLGIPRPKPSTSRLLAQVPGRRIDTFDLGDAMTQVERWGRNAKMDDELLTGYLDRLARTGGSRPGILKVVQDVMSETGGILEKAGVSDPVVRSRLTRMFADSHEDARKFFVDEIGNDVPTWTKVLSNGEMVEVGGPQLLIEAVGRYIPLPDYKPVRRLTSTMPHLLSRTYSNGEGELRAFSNFIMNAQEKVWKPMTLLRAAWPVRQVGEEQFRMAAAGRDSMFRSPISYIAYVIGRKGDTDLLGSALEEADQFKRAMIRGFGGFLDDAPNRVRTHVPTLYRKSVHEQEQFVDAWAGELAQLYTDPIARKLANSPDLDEMLEWLKGPGRNFVDELVSMGHPELLTDVGARHYLQKLAQRIDVKTGGNQELINLIKTGKLGGETALDVDGMRFARGFKQRLTSYLDDAPDAVKGQEFVSVAGKGQQSRFVDYMFQQLGARPTNYLSRSPTFKQAYWQRVFELGPRLSKEDAARLVEHRIEDGTKLPGRVRNLVGVAGKPTGEPLTLGEIDELAKDFALEQTKHLLYDLSERSQFFDAMRLVFPFGEAWKEVVTRWTGLIKQNPKVVRRAQQVIQGARGEDLGEVVGAPEGEGFFFTNEFGQEVFVYPGSAFLTEKLTALGDGPGVPIPLTGTVQGLNFLSNVMPGIGPVVQVPAAWFMSGKPAMRDIYKFVLPFGSPVEDSDSGALTQVLNYAPGWLRKMYQAARGGGFDEESDRIYNNTVMEVATYLHSTGAYDTSTPAGQQKLLEDARTKARMFYFIRGSVQFGAPSAPAPEWLTQVKDGSLVRMVALRDEYYRMLADDPDTASERFLDKWGPDVALVMTPKSRSVGGSALPATTDFADWLARHQDLKRDFPNTYQMFGPQDTDGKHFDYSVYTSQFATGDRVALSPEDWLRISNDTLGRMQMEKARRVIGARPNERQRALLRELEDAVRREYPGYGDFSGVPGRADTDTLIDELTRIADVGSVKSTDLGKALNSYLQARAAAQARAEAEGLASFKTAKSMRPMRDLLRELAGALTRETPAFANIWRVFERELADDIEEEEAA